MPSSQYYILPPCGSVVGNDDAVGQAIGAMTQLATEAASARSQWEPLVEDNLTTYIWGQPEGQPDEDQLVVNEIQNSVIAQIDVQTQEPAQISLEPVETGEPPLYFWNGPQDVGLLEFGLIPAEVAEWVDPADGQTKPPVPLDERLAGALQSVAVPKEGNPALPPGAIRPEWVVEMDDKLVADVYQTIFDVYLERSDFEEWTEQNLLDSGVQGWAWALFEYDDNADRFLLTHLPVTQVYVDPTARGIADAAYAMVDIPLDADRAKTAYPHLADQISEWARMGTPNPFDGNTQWGDAYDRDFRRLMVQFRLCWLRNQLVPMTKDEAVALGLVQEVAPYGEGQVPPVLGAVEPGAPAGADGAGDDGGGGADGLLLAAQRGQPAADAPVDGQCVLVATGQPVAPGDVAGGWPTRLGIRQITQIGQEVVDDRECPFQDIPLLLNVNIPMPGQRPFGMGEPYRLLSIQKAESQQLTSMVEHCAYFSHPTTFLSQTSADLLAKETGRAFVSPGDTITMPDQMFESAMKAGFVGVVPAPAMSTAVPQVFEMTKALLEDISGHTDVMQGRSQAGDAAAKVETLQAQASGLMRFKGRRTGYMLKRLARLGVHELVRRLTVDDMLRIVSKYKRAIVERVRERGQSIEWNVKVTVSAGAGQKMQNAQLATMYLNAGVIGRRSFSDRVGLDYQTEKQRLEGEMASAARMGMATTASPSGQTGAAQSPGEKKPQ